MSKSVNTRDFKRIDVSVTEKAIGAVIIVLLAGVALGVVQKGRNYDLKRYTGDVAALESTREAVTGKAATLRGEQDLRENETTGAPDGAPDGASADEIVVIAPGVSPMGPTEHYDRDTLFEKINGRAPAYFEFNFEALGARSFTLENPPGAFIDVFLYRMDTPLNAFGIFSFERGEAGASLDFAADGYRSEMGYFFRSGPTYAQVIASSPEAAVMDVAEVVARKIGATLPEDDSGMEARALLPPEGLMPASIAYINANAYGQQVLSNIFEARYAVDDAEVTYFAQANPDAGTARGNWESLLGFYDKYGTVTDTFEAVGADVFVAENFGQWSVIYVRDEALAGVVNAPSEAVAVGFVKARLGIKLAGIDDYESMDY